MMEHTFFMTSLASAIKLMQQAVCHTVVTERVHHVHVHILTASMSHSYLGCQRTKRTHASMHPLQKLNHAPGIYGSVPEQ